MSEEATSESGQPGLEELQEQLRRLRQEEREVVEQISRLQAEISRSRGQERRRAQMNLSAALPALQVQRQRLRAEIFRLDQQIQTLRKERGEVL